MELHAVVIRKPISIEEAYKHANDYMNTKKKTYYRETKSSYRFRNIPKQRFIAKSFKTKRINKQVSLVYGELKEKPLKKDKTKGAGYVERGNVGGNFLDKVNDFILKYNPFTYIGKKLFGSAKEDLQDRGYFQKSNRLPY